jgi:hypothetical protein
MTDVVLGYRVMWAIGSVQEKEDNSRPSDLEKSAGGLTCKSLRIRDFDKVMCYRAEEAEGPKL